MRGIHNGAGRERYLCISLTKMAMRFGKVKLPVITAFTQRRALREKNGEKKEGKKEQSGESARAH